MASQHPSTLSHLAQGGAFNSGAHANYMRQSIAAHSAELQQGQAAAAAQAAAYAQQQGMLNPLQAGAPVHIPQVVVDEMGHRHHYAGPRAGHVKMMPTPTSWIDHNDKDALRRFVENAGYKPHMKYDSEGNLIPERNLDEEAAEMYVRGQAHLAKKAKERIDDEAALTDALGVGADCSIWENKETGATRVEINGEDYYLTPANKSSRSTTTTTETIVIPPATAAAAASRPPPRPMPRRRVDGGDGYASFNVVGASATASGLASKVRSCPTERKVRSKHSKSHSKHSSSSAASRSSRAHEVAHTGAPVKYFSHTQCANCRAGACGNKH